MHNFEKLHGKLLSWYKANKRDLPWRKNRDAYRIWISEIMLQQTRVEAVIPYYERFLSVFPNLEALAASEEDKLTSLWAGLGYYSRARNLRFAAIDAMARFEALPASFENLKSLKGIGDYTAAAISSIAHGEARVALDGNLERVLSRVLGMREDPKSKNGKAKLHSFGQAIVELGQAGEINQALMDLSSALCAVKTPRCGDCPLSSACVANQEKLTGSIPLKKIKSKAIELESRGLVLLHESESGESSVLLARRKTGAWLAGLWDLPWWIIENGDLNHKLEVVNFGEHESIRTITNHKIRYRVNFARAAKRPSSTELSKKIPDCAAEYRWQSLAELSAINLPKPSEKALSHALKGIL